MEPHDLSPTVGAKKNKVKIRGVRIDVVESTRAGSLNQGAATTTAFSDPILKAAHIIVNFKRKIALVSRKHLGNTHRLGDSSHLPLLASPVFPAHHCHVLLAALAVAVAVLIV